MLTCASALASAAFEFTWRDLEVIKLGENTLVDCARALGALVLVWLVTRGVHAVLLGRLRKLAEKSSLKIDDVIVAVIAVTRWYFHAALALLVARHFLTLGSGAERFFSTMTVVGLGLQAGVWAQAATLGAVRLWTSNRGGSRHNATMAAGIQFVARLVIWVVVALAVLSNLGVQVSAVLAGLGVGGIAAALAVQGILADLFSGLSMYFDRPFDIGDAVQIDQISGTVRHIGLRTTRVAAVSGEEIVFPNGDLVKARIRNFARLRERRIVSTFGVEYGVPPEKLTRAKEIVREVMGTLEGLRLDRLHFKGLGPISLDFELVYFVTVPEYVTYMNLQERLWLTVYERFAVEGIPFAFPTQTLYLRKEG